MKTSDFLAGALFGIAAVAIVEAIQYEAYKAGRESVYREMIVVNEYVKGEGENGETIDGGKEETS